MNRSKLILLILSFYIFITGCDKQEMPHNDRIPVSKEAIVGSWSIQSTAAYLKVDNWAQSESNNLENLLESKLFQESNGSTLCFTNYDKVYCFRNQLLSDSSDYYINKDTIYLSNANLIGFYAPHFFVKKDTIDFERLIAYFGKSESMALMEEDGSIGSTYMNLIKNNIKEAQCEIRFKRDTASVYKYLFQ